MSEKAFPLPRVVRSVILETMEERLPHFRDAVTGEIQDKALTVAIIAEMDGKHRDVAKLGRSEAWAYTVYQTVREHIRHAKSDYEVHHREHVSAVRKAKSRQRRMVSFRDARGQMVTKDRLWVRKDEIPFVRDAYARIGASAADVVAWCDEVWEQMELRGLGADATVGQVCDEAA